jgi:hypothetical protein
MNITIEYMLYIQKPDYGNYNDHSSFIDDTFADIDAENDYNNEALIKKTGRLGKFNFYLDNDLTTKCGDNKCKLCLFENRTKCITCNNDNYTLDENNFTKICMEEDERTDINTSEIILYNDYSDINSLNKISDKIDLCSQDNIFNYEYLGELSNEDFNNIYNQLKNKLNNKECYQTIILTKNIIFQISELSKQINPLYPNISLIDLKGCEKIIRDKKNISTELPLIIYKIDIKNNNLSSSYVHYEIYEPINLTKIDLNIYSKINVS